LDIFNGRVPGVSLRSTSGFILSAAQRASDIPNMRFPGVPLRSTPGFMLSGRFAGCRREASQIQ